MFPTKIETENLLMKKPENNFRFINKLYSICSGDSGEKITEFMSWEPHSNIKETEELVESWVQDFEQGNSINYMLIEKDSKEFIGMGGLSTYWEREYGQLGCWLIPKFWGNGYSSERALALIELNFEDLGLNYIQVRFDKKNKKCKSCVSSYMSKVRGDKLLEHNENVRGKQRKTVVYGVSNINYKKSDGLQVIKNKEYSQVDNFF